MKTTVGSLRWARTSFFGIIQVFCHIVRSFITNCMFCFYLHLSFFFSYHVSQHSHPEVLCRADGHLISYIGSNFGKFLFDFRNSCSVKSKINSLLWYLLIKSSIGFKSSLAYAGKDSYYCGCGEI